MYRISEIASYGLRRLYIAQYRSCSPIPYRLHGVSAVENKSQYLANRRFQTSNGDRKVDGQSDANVEKEIETTFKSPDPLPPKPSSTNWVKWFLGSMVSVILPFWKDPLEKILRIQDDVEAVIDVVDTVLEGVEKVANVLGDAASDMAETLEDGTVKDAVKFVENVAKEVAKDAHIADDFIDKVDDVREDFENLIEPVVRPEKLFRKDPNPK